jgi:hypothetical protein
MSRMLLSASAEAKAAIEELFQQAAPILVEVRFPNAGTSSDWHLLQDSDQLDQLLERLGAAVELHISSVWDLQNPKGAIYLKNGTR